MMDEFASSHARRMAVDGTGAAEAVPMGAAPNAVAIAEVLLGWARSAMALPPPMPAHAGGIKLSHNRSRLKGPGMRRFWVAIR